MRSRTISRDLLPPRREPEAADRLYLEVSGLFDANPDPAWTLVEAGHDLAREKQADSRLALSNGFIGIRGDLSSGPAFERVFIAGHFTTVDAPGQIPTLAPVPLPFPLSLSIDGDRLGLDAGKTTGYGRSVDMRRGLLHSLWHQRLPSGKSVEVQALRLASLADRNVAAQVVRLRFSEAARVSVDTGATEVRLEQGQPEGARRLLAFGRSASIYVDGVRLDADRAETTARSEVLIVQVTAYGLGPDAAAAVGTVRAHLGAARRRGMPGIFRRHIEAWDERWQESEVEIVGDEEGRKALLFALYHLNSAADPNSDQVSVGARGLTGESYLGHVFWDTEVFMLPFYTLTWPAAARAMLGYRYRTLDAARRKARAQGYRGALYAWESADTGDEATPPYVVGTKRDIIPIHSGKLEQHISADVAFAAWCHWQATGDNDFLLKQGAEIILETSRFWASRVEPDGEGKFHILNVVGPDEYHDGVDDNAFTNGMARWNLLCALEVAQLLEARWPAEWRALRGRLALDESEIAEWKNIAGALVVLEDPNTGVIEQFRGYFGLRYVDLAVFGGRKAPMDVVLTPHFVRRSQIIKQPDVVMLMALLGDEYSLDQQRTNFDFYELRSGHGSSLSAPIHALMAARTGDPEFGLYYFHKTAATDLKDSFSNGGGGLHMAALAGLWQAAVSGFAGLEVDDDGLKFRPCLPARWQRLKFKARWRDRRLEVEVSHLLLVVRVLAGKPLLVRCGGRSLKATTGSPAEFLIERGPSDRPPAATAATGIGS